MALSVPNYGVNKFSEPTDPVPSPHSGCSVIFCKFSDFECYTSVPYHRACNMLLMVRYIILYRVLIVIGSFVHSCRCKDVC